MGCGGSGQSGQEGGAPVKSTASFGSTSRGITEAIQAGSSASVRKILIANPGVVSFKDSSGATLLHIAATKGKDPSSSAACIEALLERPGIDMNAVTPEMGWTALHHCASQGNGPAVKILLRSSAKHDIVDKNGLIPLHLAAKQGHSECIQAYLDIGVSTDQVDSDGRTALHLVAAGGHLGCLRPLLMAKATVLDRQSEGGRTPLHEAAAAGHAEVTEVLLEAGADKKIKDGSGMTPGQLANARGNTKCAVALGAAPREDDIEKLKATNLSNNSPAIEVPVKEEVDGLTPAGSMMFKRVQALMDQTWKDATTRDRGYEAVPRFEVVQVLRNANREKWKTYCEKREELALHHARPLDNVKTVSPEWDSEQVEPRNTEVNEFFLFHGTNPAGAQNISLEDFRLDLSGCNKGSLYGPGIYFAESSSKADEYAGDDEDGLYRGLYAMLLCRVSLGNPAISTEVKPDLEQLAKDLDATTHHSILGDREAARGTFREFIVRDTRQAFPAYVIIYRRTYDGTSEL